LSSRNGKPFPAHASPGLRTVAALVLLVATLLVAAGPAHAGYPEQIASYPRNGDPRVPPDAELYFVFDEPTSKTGSFSVADLDSGGQGGVLLLLNAPRWSALGDTVFLRPAVPMTPNHQHGMRVNTILTPDSSASDLPVILFTVNPSAPGSIAITNIVLEEPLPGAAYAAGDTVRARAVVTGFGTGPFRVVFYMDGTAIAMEEGFMENGRPVTIETRGPLPTRRLGERRLHVVVESPQTLASRPLTFLCLPPPSGLEPRRSPSLADTTAIDSVAVDSALVLKPPPLPPEPRAFTLEGTYLALGKSKFRDEESAALGWTAVRAGYRFSEKSLLEASGTWRVRADDLENGSGSPEQARVRLGLDRSSLEWGDLAPAVASEAPILAAPVPRRAAQGQWRSSLADLTAYVALESRPRSAAGPIDLVRSDLYAASLSRGFDEDRLVLAAFGGYVHDDPASGAAGLDLATRAQAMLGGSGEARFAGDWKVRAEGVTVRHRTIEGVEPGRSRTGVRGLLEGEVAGFTAKAEAFRYQPDMATSMNPYALSNRQGGSAELARDIARWRFFGGFRREEPETERPETPGLRVDRWHAGGRLSLGRKSWVIPSFIRLDHKGDGLNLRESRVAGDLVIEERYEGQTRARFDIARFEDRLSRGFEREVTAASLVSTRKYAGRVTTTISGGYEKDDQKDVEITDLTIQAALELRYEMIPGTFLIAPLISWMDRELETIVRREERFTGRLQLTWVRVPGLGDNALSLEGRIDRLDLQDPVDDTTVEGSVELSIGQRFGPH
jgi:hypothetical protein